MRVTQTGGAIAQAIRQVRQLFESVVSPSTEAVNALIDRMGYGQSPHHAKQYVRGYVQAMRDIADR